MTREILVTHEEASEAGVMLGEINTWGDKLRPVLVSKGVPESWLYVGSLKVRPKMADGWEWSKENPSGFLFEVDDV